MVMMMMMMTMMMPLYIWAWRREIQDSITCPSHRNWTLHSRQVMQWSNKYHADIRKVRAGALWGSHCHLNILAQIYPGILCHCSNTLLLKERLWASGDRTQVHLQKQSGKLPFSDLYLIRNWIMETPGLLYMNKNFTGMLWLWFANWKSATLFTE